MLTAALILGVAGCTTGVPSSGTTTSGAEVATRSPTRPDAGPSAAGTTLLASQRAELAPHALAALVERRSVALADRDKAGWVATMADPSSNQGAEDLTAYAGLAALGVTGLEVESAVPASGRVPTETEWVGTLTIGYAVPGYDRATRAAVRTVTLTWAHDGWLVAAFSGPTDRWEAFDLPGLAVARAPEALVVGNVPVADLAARFVDALAGQRAVAARLTVPVPAVVVVPATQNQAARLLGAPPADGPDQVAATTTGARMPASPATADRIVLHPGGLSRLTEVGRRVVVTHELVHVTTRATSTQDYPLWLSEGFAEWVALGDVDLPAQTVAATILGQVRATGLPAQLPPDSAFSDSGPAAAYQGAWLAVSWLERTVGADRLVAFYRSVGASSTRTEVSSPNDAAARTSAALRDGLGLTMEQVVAGWREDLQRLAG
jgi:hypothetical protein